MADREKVIRGLESCLRLCDYNACRECPYGDGTPCKLLHDALALLKERGPKVKLQFDDDALDRNAYIKVGDLIDCMTELSMPEDAAFYLTGAIEWACGKRAVALLKEQEPRVMTLDEIRSGTVEVAWIEDADKAEVIPGIWFRLSNEGEDEAVDIHIRDGFVGARLAVYGKMWRAWTSRPSPDQMRETPWEGEDDG